jgi:hypothetical protein
LNATELQRRRKGARRTTFVLVLIALAFYVGFIAMAVHRSHG